MGRFKTYFESFYDEFPGLYDYVCVDFFKEYNNELKASDILDNDELFATYPFLADVGVELVRPSHPVLNGEMLRIQTLGAGEGTIFVSKPHWEDALQLQDYDNPDPELEKSREFFQYGILHELAHAVQDREDRLDNYQDDPHELEEEAEQFAKKWFKSRYK